jgi:hypothetical protein
VGICGRRVPEWEKKFGWVGKELDGVRGVEKGPGAGMSLKLGSCTGQSQTVSLPHSIAKNAIEWATRPPMIVESLTNEV